ncbi:MAG: EAL domain-containing protein [Sphingobium sp.]|nr:EAL domain-containing protein [Sphingobium sp.]
MAGKNNTSNLYYVQRELITGSVVIAAIVMFIWTGGSAMTAVVRYLTGVGPNVEQILLTTLLLNIALILFGWRRYRDLQIEVLLRREAEERANSLAETDSLTGFLNRRSMAERSAMLLKSAKATSKSVAVFMLDLDNFKKINDIHGHAAGDTVLATVASRIKELIPPSALAARQGGDEFTCAFVFDPNSPENVDHLAEELVASIAKPIIDNGLHLSVSASIGIDASCTDREALDALMQHADIAMYCAKKKGRNCYMWFDELMGRELHTRNMLEEGIRRGIPNGEFVPYFEPQIDLSNNSLIGFEALARWNRPTLGVMMPERFIPIAEESNLITDLSLAIMQQAFVEARTWNSALTLSVNISPAQLMDSWLSHKIQKLLMETGFPANRLEVEITESALFENIALAQAIVASLKNQNIRVALDEFGSGYSSLAHLRALPFDRIKISRSFVSSVNQSNESASIVGAIIQLGKSLNLPVTAEGIEDSKTETKLREMGCSAGQGWHFGKPMPADETARMLADRGLLVSAPMRDEASVEAYSGGCREAG